MQTRSLLVVAMGFGVAAGCGAKKSETSEEKELVVAKPAEVRRDTAKDLTLAAQ